MLTAWLINTYTNVPDKQYISNRTDRIDAIYTYKIYSNDNFYCRVGGGGRYYGNLGGAKLQDTAHRAIGSDGLDEEYENDAFNYDETTGLGGLGQAIIGGISPKVDIFNGFFNINGDITTKKEVSYHGFAGVDIEKMLYMGVYVNAERKPYSETVLAYRNTAIDEDNIGIRLALCFKNIYADISVGQTRSHVRLGFSF